MTMLMDQILAAQGQSRASLGVAAARLVDMADDAAILGLPFVLRVAHPRSGFLAVARTPSDLARLRESAAAFIGRTYGDISWENERLGADDAVRSALVEAGYCWAFMIERRPEGKPAEAIESLRDRVIAMMDLLGRSKVPHERSRSLAHVLRDLERALLTDNEPSFEEHFTVLRGLGALSEDALRFLEVRRLVTFGRSAELWTSGLIAWLLAVRRPRLVTELLLEAIAQQQMGSIEGCSPAELADRFRESILPAYGAAFTAVAHVPEAPGARLLLTLFAATAEPPRRDLLEILLAEPNRPDHQALQALVDALLGPVPASPESSLSEANEAVERRDFGAVVDLVRDLPPSSERARLLVVAAFELPDPAIALLAREAVGELDDQQRQELPTSAAFLRRLDGLRSIAPSSRYPTSPDEWVEVLLEEPGWHGALEVARAGASGEWVAHEFFQERERVNTFAERLLEAWISAPDSVISAMPHLERFVADVESDNAVRYRLAIVHVLAADDHASMGDLVSLIALLEGVLPAVLPDSMYGELLIDMQKLWERRLDSFERLDWGLAVVDVVARSPKGDHGAMRAFVQAVVMTVERSAHRLTRGELAYVRALLAECNMPGLLDHIEELAAAADEETETVGLWDVLNDRTLGIHCLFDPIVVRLKALIGQLAPAATVAADTSHDCSPALKALCHRAEVFVLVTQHAKHAATSCVERLVSPDALVRSSQSRVGVTGVLRALEGHLRRRALAEAGA